MSEEICNSESWKLIYAATTKFSAENSPGLSVSDKLCRCLSLGKGPDSRETRPWPEALGHWPGQALRCQVPWPGFCSPEAQTGADSPARTHQGSDILPGRPGHGFTRCVESAVPTAATILPCTALEPLLHGLQDLGLACTAGP